MYSTCLFCHHSLGANQVIEQFPVGRRLAFDSAKGRLWVICTVCERWNLTPLEERWEATEACERLVRAATLRVSTGQIGLARVGDGLRLVRIGEPLRPEMAAWRYGDRFGRRRRRMIARAALGGGLLGTAIVGGIAIASVAVGIGIVARAAAQRRTEGDADPAIAVVRAGASDDAFWVVRTALPGVRLAWDNERSDWALEVPAPQGRLTLRGASALRAAAVLLPVINRTGGTERSVHDAVGLLEHHGSPDALFRWLASEWDGTASGYRDRPDGRVEFVAEGARGFLSRLEPAQRLALEMAAHEETERQAMQGELAALERAWRDAEEVAAIADDLLIPAAVRDFIARHRSR